MFLPRRDNELRSPDRRLAEQFIQIDELVRRSVDRHDELADLDVLRLVNDDASLEMPRRLDDLIEPEALPRIRNRGGEGLQAGLCEVRLEREIVIGARGCIEAERPYLRRGPCGGGRLFDESRAARRVDAGDGVQHIPDQPGMHPFVGDRYRQSFEDAALNARPALKVISDNAKVYPCADLKSMHGKQIGMQCPA